jgi:hypothetical protein
VKKKSFWRTSPRIAALTQILNTSLWKGSKGRLRWAHLATNNKYSHKKFKKNKKQYHN